MRIGLVKPSGLNLRKDAHPDARILDQLAEGERVYVSDLRHEGWVFVTVDETRQSGWVKAQHLDIAMPQLPPTAPARKPPRPPSEYQEFALWAAVVVIAIVIAALFATAHWR